MHNTEYGHPDQNDAVRCFPIIWNQNKTFSLLKKDTPLITKHLDYITWSQTKIWTKNSIHDVETQNVEKS